MLNMHLIELSKIWLVFQHSRMKHHPAPKYWLTRCSPDFRGGVAGDETKGERWVCVSGLTLWWTLTEPNYDWLYTFFSSLVPSCTYYVEEHLAIFWLRWLSMSCDYLAQNTSSFKIVYLPMEKYTCIRDWLLSHTCCHSQGNGRLTGITMALF